MANFFTRFIDGSDRTVEKVVDGSDGIISAVGDNLSYARTSRTGELVEGAASSTYKGVKGILGKSAIAAAIVGGVVALPFVLNGMKNSRRYPKSDPLPPEAAPLPPVMMDPTANTMMGLQPVLDGPMSQRVLAQRSGAAGIDPTNPGLMDVDGSGQQPQALGRF